MFSLISNVRRRTLTFKSKMNWKELFPTKFSIFIFVFYMFLFVNQGIFVTASQSTEKKYNYNVVTVVLLTEVFKMVVSVVLYCQSNSFLQLFKDSVKHKKVFIFYFVPALLYCLYNNLSFINLSLFDPTTYFLLLQFRVVITAVLFQLIFKKQLSRKQWFSLILLTLGCMVKQLNVEENAPKSFKIDISSVMILVQGVCSCLAGVYNEYLLKADGADIDIYVQNFFMYVDSIVCSVIILLLQGNLMNSFTYENVEAVFQYKVIIVMIINTAIGITTSFFLKSLNSILKTFASALELLFTAIACYILFGIPVHWNTALAIVIVSYSVVIYSQNPVNNTMVGSSATEQVEEEVEEEEEKLLTEEV